MKKNCIFYVLMLLAMMCTRSYASPVTDCSTCDPNTDYQALRQLYLDTDGNNWTSNTNWPDEAAFLVNPNSPPNGHVSMGTWYGVKTNSAGCVTRLSLQNNQLIGSVPQEIGNLSDLTRLYLHTNQLGSSIPPEIGDLSNLTILNMRDNQFTGNIPTTIGNLNALESLNLSVNQLGGGIPLTIGNLTNLRSLLLNNNQLNGGIPSVIENLSALESFYVHYNQLSGGIPMEIGNLSNLRQVYFAHNQLSGCYDTNLSNLCNQLTYSSNARISDGNNFDAAWEDFCSPSQTGACIINNCLNDDYAALRAFYFSTNGISWADNSGWPLAGNFPLTSPPGTDLSTWYGVTLDASGCVSELSMCNNNVTGTLPLEIGDLANLTWLWLPSNDIGGAIPSEIGDLANLVRLDLRDNELTDNIPIELGNLANLTWLDLGINQLIGGIPAELGNLTNLEWLDLHYNQLTGDMTAELGNLPNLNSLWIYGNELSGCYDPNLLNLCSQLNPIFNDNSYISHGNDFDAPWEGFCDFGQGICLPPTNDVCPVPDNFALRPGDAFVTCYSGFDPTNPSVPIGPIAGIKNVDEVEPNHAGDYANDLSTQLNPGAMFSRDDIGGEVFGTCIDNEGDIYVTATTLYGYTDTAFASQNGYASIVKINGSNLTLDPGFVATLASNTMGFDNASAEVVSVNTAVPTGTPPILACDTTHSGLGNICYDANNDNLLVTNFEDGRIWIISKTGIVLGSYDPFDPDDGVAGFAPLGERLWAIQAHPLNSGETEVFFGVWNTDRRKESNMTNQCGPYNEALNYVAAARNTIWSVRIDASGNFNPGSLTYIDDVPDIASFSVNDANQPVSDIAISKDGKKMIIACRTMAADVHLLYTSNSVAAHHSTLFYLDRTVAGTNTWSAPLRFNVSNRTDIGNSAGGVDFAPLQAVPDYDTGSVCDQMVWATGDYLQFDPAERIYGLQGFSINEIFNPNPVDILSSYLIDADTMIINPPGNKTFMGDIEVFKCDCIDCQISSTLMPAIQPDSTCCYTLDLSNISVSSQAASIQIDITGPAGVFFDQSSIMTAPGFNLNNYSPTSLTIDNNGGLLPNGNNNYLRFCFGNSSPTTVPNQTFTIRYFDISGNELIDCQQEFSTDCELPPADEDCVDVTAVSVECDSLYGHFKFTYQVTNLTNDQILDNLDFTVVNPATGIVLSATSNPIIAPIGPGQTSTDQCIGVYDFPPGPYPKQVDFIFSATGYHQSDSSSYCCHDRLDTLSIELPDCTNCIDVVDYDIYCDSLGDYYLDFCVENNSTPSFVADELDIAKLSSTPPWLGLSQYVWDNTHSLDFPLMSGESFCETVQIIGSPLANGDMIELEFRFNNIAQDSCCAEREVLNLTLECCDYVPDLPHCNDCVDRVEVIEYQGEKYVIYWADSLCSDALTIVYNYCDGTEFCREGGLLGETVCSDLMPNLFDNYIFDELLWSKDTDCTDTCCLDSCEFFDRVNAPVLTNAPDLGSCTMDLTTLTLNDCDQVSIDWGDGIVEGPFPAGNVAVSHTYSPGTYEAIMYVQEIGADGNACWEGVSRFEVQTGCTGKQPVEEVSVFRNYPNPFTEQTMIEFTLTKDAAVTLLVYDSTGRKIAMLLDTDPITTGRHEVTFDGKNHPPGAYYYTIRAGDFFGTQKMVLVK